MTNFYVRSIFRCFTALLLPLTILVAMETFITDLSQYVLNIHIFICIFKYQSEYLYLHSYLPFLVNPNKFVVYSPFFVKQNIFTFILTLFCPPKYICNCICQRNINTNHNESADFTRPRKKCTSHDPERLSYLHV